MIYQVNISKKIIDNNSSFFLAQKLDIGGKVLLQSGLLNSDSSVRYYP